MARKEQSLSGILSLKRGLQSATERVYGRFELFLFQFVTISRPSLE